MNETIKKPTILDGKATAQEIRNEISKKVAERLKNGLKVPHLAAVLVGTDGGSETYVNFKVQDCKEVGFESTLIRKPDTISEKELLDLVCRLLLEKKNTNHSHTTHTTCILITNRS